MRQLVVEHEPVVRAAESLASTISLYERVAIDRVDRGTGSTRMVEVASKNVADAMTACLAVAAACAG